jgi:hypothetical protein
MDKHTPTHNAGPDLNNGGNLGLPRDQVDFDDIMVDDKEEDNNEAGRSPLSYQSILADCELLLRLVQGEKYLLASLSTTIQMMTERARTNQKIDVMFGTILPCTYLDMSRSTLPGRLGTRPNAVLTHQKRSRHENHQSHRVVGARASQDTGDQMLVSHNVKTKTCGLCREHGHKALTCPKSTIWKSPRITDRGEWDTLSTNLLKPSYFQTVPLGENCKTVACSLPQRMTDIVLYQRVSFEMNNK